MTRICEGCLYNGSKYSCWKENRETCLSFTKYNKLTIQGLKLWAIKEFIRRGCVGVYRWYWGNKNVIEFDANGDSMIPFWDLWKIEKEKLKKIGFGVWKDKGSYDPFWLLFCETKYIPHFAKEFEKYQYLYERYKPYLEAI